MQGQYTKLAQQQKLSPRQIQLMQLVQLPLTALEERIKEELEANPALEEDYGKEAEDSDSDKESSPEEEAPDFEDYFQSYIEDDPASYNQNNAEEQYRPEAAQQTSFLEHLEEQLQSLSFTDEHSQIIAEQLIGNINDDGYLGRKITAISDDLLLRYELDVRPVQIEAILQLIQQLDPPGVGARDLQECLLIQLDRKIEEEDFQNDAQLADLVLARQIIAEQYEAFSKKHFDKIIDRLAADEDEVRDALGEILRLNPKPASGFAGKSNSERGQALVPDFIVFNQGEALELQLPKRRRAALRVSQQYEDMLAQYQQKKKDSKSGETLQFIKDKIEAAQWFIEAIQQRRDTLEGVMSVIMTYQRDYFLSGDEKKLRPMILKDIAEPLSLDISTISRVVNSKYVQTPYGTFSLKKFFSEGMLNEEGEEVSTTEIKAVLAEIIQAEDKKQPLNDTELQAALEAQGYPIARRTVAKYREQLNYPVARLRKEL